MDAYCFARPGHAYLGLSPGLDFETKLFRKPDAGVAGGGVGEARLRADTIRLAPTPTPISRSSGGADPRSILEVLDGCNHESASSPRARSSPETWTSSAAWRHALRQGRDERDADRSARRMGRVPPPRPSASGDRDLAKVRCWFMCWWRRSFRASTIEIEAVLQSAKDAGACGAGLGCCGCRTRSRI